jgi:hypothetical protein
MIDLDHAFRHASLPGIVAYPDDRAPERWYPLPEQPRTSRGDGAPEIGLTVYGRTTGPTFQATGGLLVWTTSLALTGDEERRLRAMLATRLGEASIRRPKDQAAAVELSSPDWQDGRVDIQFIPGLILTGRPSLIGVNQCAFNQNLAASQADQLEAAWRDGLPQGSVTYELRLGAAPAATSSRTTWKYVHRQTSVSDERHEYASAEHAAGRRPGAQRLMLRGPIAVSIDDLRRSVRRIDIGT